MDEHEARIKRNADPTRIQAAEQYWATVEQRIDTILNVIRAAEPDVYTNAAGNTDGSALFDWVRGYVKFCEASAEDQKRAHLVTCQLLAGALTRLVRQDNRTDAILADLEKEIDKP